MQNIKPKGRLYLSRAAQTEHTAPMGGRPYLVNVWQAAASRVAGDTTSWVAGGDVGHLWVQAVGQVKSAEVCGELHIHTQHTHTQMVSISQPPPPLTHANATRQPHVDIQWVKKTPLMLGRAWCTWGNPQTSALLVNPNQSISCQHLSREAHSPELKESSFFSGRLRMSGESKRSHTLTSHCPSVTLVKC